jgi:ABC-2 type transport system permease protein
MITRIARKEFTEMIRDGRYAWAAAIIFTLLTVSLLTGWRQHAEVKRQQTAAQESQRAFWLDQGARNPHSAAHYGVYAFKPQLALAAVDKGLDPYLGVSQFLEAHRQNAAQFRPVEDATPLARFGELTAATTLQVLLPLLIILLGYNAFAGERENRTLRQLLSLGVSKTQLTLGKALGVAAPLALLLIPATVLGVAAMALNAGVTSMWLSLPRLAVMSACYLAYFAIFIGLALIVSARASSARTALVVLLGFWFLNSLVAARLVTDVGKAAYPTPTAVEFNKAMRGETQAAEMKGSQLLGKYFQDHPELAKPDNTKEANGEDDFAMLSIAKDELVGRALQPVLARFNSQLAAQHQFTNRFRFVSPAILMQTALYDIAGTGVARYQHFLTQVEGFHQTWQGFFNLRVFEKRAISSNELNQLPQFNWQEESFAALAPRALWPALLLLLVAEIIGGLGLRRYQTYPITG